MDDTQLFFDESGCSITLHQVHHCLHSLNIQRNPSQQCCLFINEHDFVWTLIVFIQKCWHWSPFYLIPQKLNNFVALISVVHQQTSSTLLFDLPVGGFMHFQGNECQCSSTNITIMLGIFSNILPQVKLGFIHKPSRLFEQFLIPFIGLGFIQSLNFV
jgi:hypothetical protein